MPCPTPEKTEEMLKEHPEWWIRASAVNMSARNASHFTAKMAWEDRLMSSIRSRVDTDKICMDGCGPLPEEDHFFYKYQLILEGETAPWQRVPWMMLGGFVLLF